MAYLAWIEVHPQPWIWFLLTITDWPWVEAWFYNTDGSIFAVEHPFASHVYLPSLLATFHSNHATTDQSIPKTIAAITCHATLYHTTPYLTTAISPSHQLGLKRQVCGHPPHAARIFFVPPRRVARKCEAKLFSHPNGLKLWSLILWFVCVMPWLSWLHSRSMSKFCIRPANSVHVPELPQTEDCSDRATKRKLLRAEGWRWHGCYSRTTRE